MSARGTYRMECRRCVSDDNVPTVALVEARTHNGNAAYVNMTCPVCREIAPVTLLDAQPLQAATDLAISLRERLVNLANGWARESGGLAYAGRTLRGYLGLSK